MKLAQPWAERLAQLKGAASRLRGRLRKDGDETQALAELLRPDLGGTPEPLRRFLEPVAAVLALTALGWLFAVGAVSLTALVLASGLAYLILTRIFGLELDVGSLDPSVP